MKKTINPWKGCGEFDHGAVFYKNSLAEITQINKYVTKKTFMTSSKALFCLFSFRLLDMLHNSKNISL